MLDAAFPTFTQPRYDFSHIKRAVRRTTGVRDAMSPSPWSSLHHLAPSQPEPALTVTPSLLYRVSLDVEAEVKKWIRFQFPLKWKDSQVLLTF